MGLREGSWFIKKKKTPQNIALRISARSGLLHAFSGDEEVCNYPETTVSGMSWFGFKIGADWPQIVQIWEFLRSVSVHIGSTRQNVLKLILKKSPRFVLFAAHLTKLGGNLDIPGLFHR